MEENRTTPFEEQQNAGAVSESQIYPEGASAREISRSTELGTIDSSGRARISDSEWRRMNRNTSWKDHHFSLEPSASASTHSKASGNKSKVTLREARQALVQNEMRQALEQIQGLEQRIAKMCSVLTDQEQELRTWELKNAQREGWLRERENSVLRRERSARRKELQLEEHEKDFNFTSGTDLGSRKSDGKQADSPRPSWMSAPAMLRKALTNARRKPSVALSVESKHSPVELTADPQSDHHSRGYLPVAPLEQHPALRDSQQQVGDESTVQAPHTRALSESQDVSDGRASSEPDRNSEVVLPTTPMKHLTTSDRTALEGKMKSSPTPPSSGGPVTPLAPTAGYQGAATTTSSAVQSAAANKVTPPLRRSRTLLQRFSPFTPNTPPPPYRSPSTTLTPGLGDRSAATTITPPAATPTPFARRPASILTSARAVGTGFVARMVKKLNNKDIYDGESLGTSRREEKARRRRERLEREAKNASRKLEEAREAERDRALERVRELQGP